MSTVTASHNLAKPVFMLPRWRRGPPHARRNPRCRERHRGNHKPAEAALIAVAGVLRNAIVCKPRAVELRSRRARAFSDRIESKGIPESAFI